MKRVAIYARVSTDKQQTSNQVLVLKEIAERSGYNIIQIYEDKGISGSKGREDRPALYQMMKDATHRKFDMFFSQQSIDTTQSSGRMLFSIMGAIGEFEKSLIKERVLAGLDRARKNGTKLGRPSNMTDGLKSAILILKDKGLGVRETCRKLGIGCATYYKVVAEG